MDESLTQAARALARGEPLVALSHVTLREDASALALRGIAMAQIGDYRRARTLLGRSLRGLPGDALVGRARCVVALAEVSLASRSTDTDLHSLEAAERTLAQAGERDNAARAQLVRAGLHLLAGDVALAERTLAGEEDERVGPKTRAARALARFDVALRRGHAKHAREHAEAAVRHAVRSEVPALVAEARAALERVSVPCARVAVGGEERRVNAVEAERALDAARFAVDVRSRTLCLSGARTPLVSRPVLFALLRALAAAYPSPAKRADLIGEAFGARHAHPSLRARLRVEVGRLRRVLVPFASVRATAEGFVLALPHDEQATVIAPIEDGVDATLLALLEDGAAWPTASLAQALGTSMRTVQRALVLLTQRGHVVVQGRGRARRVVKRPSDLSSFGVMDGGGEDVVA